jgi:hypothetical protein
MDAAKVMGSAQRLPRAVERTVACPMQKDNASHTRAGYDRVRAEYRVVLDSGEPGSHIARAAPFRGRRWTMNRIAQIARSGLSALRV